MVCRVSERYACARKSVFIPLLMSKALVGERYGFTCCSSTTHLGRFGAWSDMTTQVALDTMCAPQSRMKDEAVTTDAIEESRRLIEESLCRKGVGCVLIEESLLREG